MTLAGGTVAVDVEVGYTTVNGTTTTADYSSRSRGTLTIGAGETSGTIKILTLDDNLEERERETFSVELSLSGQPDGVTLGIPTATATITDAQKLAVGLVGPANVAEGLTATYTVELENGVGSENVVVTYSVVGDNAEAGVDYTAPSGVLTIGKGRTTGTIQIRTLEDDAADDNTVIVKLTNANTEAGSVKLPSAPDDSVETMIRSAETAIVSVADAKVAEGGAATFSISVTGGRIAAAFDVTYQVIAGTAEAGTDYTDTDQEDGTVALAAGARSARVTVLTLEDAFAEADEKFTVTLTETEPNVELGRATGTGTITDDDTLSVSVAGPVSVIEPKEEEDEPQTANFTVSLGGATRIGAVTVFYEVGGTATAAEDYTAPTGPLNITTGDTKTIAIPVVWDNVLEGTETLTVTLTEVTTTTGKVRLGTPKQASTTIEDRHSTVIVSLPDAPPATPEGDKVMLAVTLSAEVASDVIVSYATADDTAIAGTDYVAVADATLTIAAGKTTGMITVQTLQDDLAEEDEKITVTLSLSDPPDGVVLGTAAATQTITNEEDVVRANVTAPMNVPEGKTVTFTVTLTGGTGSDDVVVDYTVGASGTRQQKATTTKRQTGGLRSPNGRQRAQS